MKVSDHFSLEELCESEIAMRKGIDNTLPDDMLQNIRLLAAGLERVRYVLKVPVYISSGYRCPELNKAVGGSTSSDHMKAQAADFTAPAHGTPAKIAQTLEDAREFIQFKQLIQEGRWVHISFDDTHPARMETLTAHFDKGGVSYTRGLA